MRAKPPKEAPPPSPGKKPSDGASAPGIRPAAEPNVDEAKAIAEIQDSAARCWVMKEIRWCGR